MLQYVALDHFVLSWEAAFRGQIPISTGSICAATGWERGRAPCCRKLTGPLDKISNHFQLEEKSVFQAPERQTHSEMIPISKIPKCKEAVFVPSLPKFAGELAPEGCLEGCCVARHTSKCFWMMGWAVFIVRSLRLGNSCLRTNPN